MKAPAADQVSNRPASLPEGEEWLEKFLREGCIFPAGEDRVWIGWGEPRRSTFPVETRASIYAPDFLLEEPHPWHIFADSAEVGYEELIDALASRAGLSPEFEWEEPAREPFEAAFFDIQERIASGELSKAVTSIVRCASGGLEPAQRAHVIRNVLRTAKNSPLMPCGLWTGEEGMIGATPEVLFDQSASGILETMALAGTRRSNGESISLLNDPKEVFEHQVVVSGIVERLKPFGHVEVGETREIHLPTLIHLLTRIAVRNCEHVEFSEWVTALHPTPAIGAWPLEAGWRWLRSQTNARSRRRYGAPFGLIPPGQTTGRCLVAIRNLQWDRDRAWITAGGGIVAASVLEREWVEFNSKLDSVQEALDI